MRARKTSRAVKSRRVPGHGFALGDFEVSTSEKAASFPQGLVHGVKPGEAAKVSHSTVRQRGVKVREEKRVVAQSLADTVLKKPTLVIVSGMPGSGKTSFADDLARATGMARMDRDIVHKVFLEKPKSQDDPEWVALRNKTYPLVEAFLKKHAQLGSSMIAEAPFWKVLSGNDRMQKELQELCDKHGVQLKFVRLKVPKATTMERLEKRNIRDDLDMVRKLREDTPDAINKRETIGSVPHLSLSGVDPRNDNVRMALEFIGYPVPRISSERVVGRHPVSGQKVLVRSVRERVPGKPDGFEAKLTPQGARVKLLGRDSRVVDVAGTGRRELLKAAKSHGRKVSKAVRKLLR